MLAGVSLFEISILAVFSAILVGVLAAITPFDPVYYGHKIYKVRLLNNAQGELMKSLELKPGYDFLNGVRRSGHPTTVMVSPDVQNDFQASLKKANIAYETLVDDVGVVLDKDQSIRQQEAEIPKHYQELEPMFSTRYNGYHQSMKYLRQIEKQYPDTVKLEIMGKSVKERNITVVKITAAGRNKPVILIDGGMNPREWIGPTAVIHLIKELVHNLPNRKLLDGVDFHVVPFPNPDGFNFALVHDRIWRMSHPGSTGCVGVDLTRNFDFKWMTAGASSNSCMGIYAGPSAGSEPETKAFVDYVNKNKKRIKLYLTFNTCGRYILYPWAYTSELPSDWQVLRNLGLEVNLAISRLARSNFQVSSFGNVSYLSSGSSANWVKGVGGINLSYTIAPSCGDGNDVFFLKPEKIFHAVREIWFGIVAFHDYVAKNFGV